MEPFRSPRNIFAETDHTQQAYIAKLKFRYLVEKELEGAWVPMARLSAEAELDRIRELAFALGGHVRVEDLMTHEFVLTERFE